MFQVDIILQICRLLLFRIYNRVARIVIFTSMGLLRQQQPQRVGPGQSPRNEGHFDCAVRIGLLWVLAPSKDNGVWRRRDQTMVTLALSQCRTTSIVARMKAILASMFHPGYYSWTSYMHGAAVHSASTGGQSTQRGNRIRRVYKWKT